MPRKTVATFQNTGKEYNGFNEAAARCRGKPTLTAGVIIDAIASMRPRPDAAENSPSRKDATPSSTGFNEAAARCRGKRPVCVAVSRQRTASMRPRPDAAENGIRIANTPATAALQ